MTDKVLDCRIYFTDDGNAQNAYDHLVALMEHARAHAVHVGGRMEKSWVRLHECHAPNNTGDTTNCITIAVHKIGGAGEPTEGDFPQWQPYDGTPDTIYSEGDTVTHNDLFWVSTVNDNVWEPGQYGWSQVEGPEES